MIALTLLAAGVIAIPVASALMPSSLASGIASSHPADQNVVQRTPTSPLLVFGGFFGSSVAASGRTVIVGTPQETVEELGGAVDAYIF